MTSSALTKKINDRAAQWAVDTAYGDGTPEERAGLEAWLAEDNRHRGAYMRACASLYMMEDTIIEASQQTNIQAHFAANDDASSATRPSFMRNSSRFLWGISGVAAGVAIAASLAFIIVPQLPYFSPPAQISHSPNQILTLQDGSVATLASDARISFVMVDGTRQVTVLQGQARFNVAHDKQHPFVVRSGDVYAQATGTVYSVSRHGETGGVVKVSEGSVLVWLHDDRDQAVVLHAGESVTLEPASKPPLSVPKKPKLPPPDIAKISLDDVPIKEAAARFNRINSTKIIITDPAIGNIKIVGLYRADDPLQFAQSAATISGGIVEHVDKNIVIKMK